jgi:hypothetical protein
MADGSSIGLRIADVPSQRGVAWVRESFALFLKSPFAFSLLFMLFLVVALVLMALPFVGSLLLLAAMPLLTLGFAAATRAAQQGQAVKAGLLFEPLKGAADAKRRGALLRLCLSYAAATALVMLLAQAIDGGGFERLQILLAAERSADNKAQIDALLADSRLAGGMLLRVTLIAALSVPFWHAPMLVWWDGQGLAQSLFSSTLACWRNRGAFIVNMLVWAGLGIAFGIAASVLITVLGAAPELVTVLLPPAVLMFSVVFYVSLYLMYADCFAVAAPPIRQSSS